MTIVFLMVYHDKAKRYFWKNIHFVLVIFILDLVILTKHLKKIHITHHMKIEITTFVLQCIFGKVKEKQSEVSTKLFHLIVKYSFCKKVIQICRDFQQSKDFVLRNFSPPKTFSLQRKGRLRYINMTYWDTEIWCTNMSADNEFGLVICCWKRYILILSNLISTEHLHIT